MIEIYNMINMKSIFSIINSMAVKIILGLSLILMSLSACKNDEDGGGPISITKVYLQDATSTVTDREVKFARLGQLVRIEGSGFNGLKKVYVNGFSTYFNPVFVSDNSMLVAINEETPIVDADSSVRNTIRLANENYEATYSIEIRSSAPAITGVSNTMPIAGETITIFGTGLLEVNKIIFPGNIEVSSGIVSDEDGESCMVTVPTGIPDEGGSIIVECSNGGAYSPAYFNFKKGILLNFDGNGVHGSWGDAVSMIKPEDLASASLGTVNISQGIYVPHRPVRITSYAAAKNRCSEVWTAGTGTDDWRGQLTSYIPATTPLDSVAFQFDIYVPQAWSGSGFLKICLVNGFNGGEWAGNCYNYVPWVVEGEIVPFLTTGWTTVTIPLSKLYAFSDKKYTFEDVLAVREAAQYQNFGIYFENSDFTLDKITGNTADKDVEFPSASTSVDVYTDNWRIVSITTPSYNDFPDK
jgi:hypothetical protein